MNPLFRFLLLLLALCPLTLSANPLLFAQLEARLVTHLYKGKVMTRAQVVGDSGGPILVKVRSSGDSESVETEEVATIGEVYPGGSLDGAYVLSGAEYSYFLKLYQRLKQEQPGKLGRAVFLSRAQLESGVPLADGGHSQTVNLPDDIKTVLVLGQSERFGESPSGWTLMEVPFQMDEGTHLEEGVSSVLLKANGEVHKLAYGSRDEGGAFSIETFTYRVAYYGKGEDALKQSEERREFSDRVFGPVAGQVLSTDQSGTLSNPDGVYTMLEVRPCVGINIGGEFVSGFTMEQLLVLEVAASTGSVFNPEGKTHLPLFISKLVPFICHNNARRTYTRDFVVDTLWLTGKMRLANEESGPAIPIGGEMRYQAQSQAGALTAQNHYDFDGDGEPDRALLANKVEREDDAGNTYVVPEAAPDGDWQAVYFSSGSKSPNAEDVANRVPDVWRLPDRTLPGEDSQHTGLLKQISRDAMISTDLYIFRESTGEMIVEVNGLPIGTGNADWRLDTEENTYTWNTIMRGPRQYAMTGGVCHSGQRGASCLLNTLYDGSGDSERGLLADRGEDAVRASNEQLGYSSRYRGRDSGLPAPGEQLYAVAINRATGYVGTARFKLGNISSGEGLENGTITQQVPDITLTPPRLQIWARRLSNIESGLTQGERVQYLIGHEGAATKDDTIVGIYTRWMGSDGRPFPASIPLPEGLGSGHGEHYGLTGRLNKISGGQLTPATAGRSLDGLEVNLSDSERKDCAQRDTEYEEEQCLETYRLSQATDKAKGAEMTAEFPIAPGQQLQLVQLPNDLSKNQHFYVTVYGRPLNKEAMPRDPFDATGDQTGLLSGRPNLYTPFYVPRYDEAATLEEQLIRNQQDNETDDDTTSGRVPPQYRWMQRPEYQFSLVDLTVGQINAIDFSSDNSDSPINLLGQNHHPALSEDYDLIDIMYQVLVTNESPLPSVDGPREYVLAVGENEVEVTLTPTPDDSTSPLFNQVTIDNLDHLSDLAAEDQLTIRLFLNHDPENYLWEWAFETEMKVTTSYNPESNLAQSFIICDEPAENRGACKPGEQGPITAELLIPLKGTDVVEWRVEALPGVGCDENGENCPTDDLPLEKDGGSGDGNKPTAYGKTKKWKRGQYFANEAANPSTAEGSGEFGKPFISNEFQGEGGRYFSFEPDMSEELHTPAKYQDENVHKNLRGTRKKDVWRHNPHVGYEVVAIVNGKEYSTRIQMDEIDAVRQEYINHNINYSNVPVPDRRKFEKVKSTRNFLADELNNTPFAIVPGNPGSLAEAIRAEYNSRIHDDIQSVEVGASGLQPDTVVISPGKNINGIGPILDTPACHGSSSEDCDDYVDGEKVFAGPNGIAETTALNAVTDYDLLISSPWRNPERNERVGGVINSKHQLGSAIDLVVLPVPGKQRRELFCILQTAADSISGYRAIAEIGSDQVSCDRTGDNGTSVVSHVHVQEN